MQLVDFINIINYSDFSICENSEKGLKEIFRINKDTPIKYISSKLLDKEIEMVYINDKNNENDLFVIELKKSNEEE